MEGLRRVIGKYKGNKPGPLLVITAGMHGNEPAGIRALETLFTMLEEEPTKNPDFSYCGEIIGITGNIQACARGSRFVTKDINRAWEPGHVEHIRRADKSTLVDEDLEMREIIDTITSEIARLSPGQLYLMDLHTTSADGGIFCIATSARASIDIAHEIHAPVIIGLLNGLHGTTLHYFNENNLGIPATAIAFEGGRHSDPLSADRCIAAIINLMRAIKVIRPEDVENRHDNLLRQFSEGLPEIVEVIYKYHVEDNHKWKMLSGYYNFKPVSKGEQLANYDGKPVTADCDGYILMPLYHHEGHDGFFIVREVT